MASYCVSTYHVKKLLSRRHKQSKIFTIVRSNVCSAHQRDQYLKKLSGGEYLDLKPTTDTRTHERVIILSMSNCPNSIPHIGRKA